MTVVPSARAVESILAALNRDRHKPCRPLRCRYSGAKRLSPVSKASARASALATGSGTSCEHLSGATRAADAHPQHEEQHLERILVFRYEKNQGCCSATSARPCGFHSFVIVSSSISNIAQLLGRAAARVGLPLVNRNTSSFHTIHTILAPLLLLGPPDHFLGRSAAMELRGRARGRRCGKETSSFAY